VGEDGVRVRFSVKMKSGLRVADMVRIRVCVGVRLGWCWGYQSINHWIYISRHKFIASYGNDIDTCDVP